MWEIAGMRSQDDRDHDIPLETPRLVLRPWQVTEAHVMRELWTERDPRVPPHRRVDADGSPSIADLEARIRSTRSSSGGLLAVERRVEGDVIGYCGLVSPEPEPEPGTESEAYPELAFEFLRRTWGHGYATEASIAVVTRARSAGHRRLSATVWDWNTASRRVLAKLGFVETGRLDRDPVRGITLHLVKDL